ncbi:MAG: hypothetical protein ACXWT4_11140 [Methylobacter sp.]
MGAQLLDVFAIEFAQHAAVAVGVVHFGDVLRTVLGFAGASKLRGEQETNLGGRQSNRSAFAGVIRTHYALRIWAIQAGTGDRPDDRQKKGPASLQALHLLGSPGRARTADLVINRS